MVSASRNGSFAFGLDPAWDLLVEVSASRNGSFAFGLDPARDPVQNPSRNLLVVVSASRNGSFAFGLDPAWDLLVEVSASRNGSFAFGLDPARDPVQNPSRNLLVVVSASRNGSFAFALEHQNEKTCIPPFSSPNPFLYRNGFGLDPARDPVQNQCFLQWLENNFPVQALDWKIIFQPLQKTLILDWIPRGIQSKSISI